MAKDDTASVITLHQPKRAKTGAERARAYREKKATSLVAKEVVPALPVPTEHAAGAPTMLTPVTPHDIVKTATVTLRQVTASRPSRFKPNIFLALAALALAGVGTVQNGWFAQSMGATPVAGTLFLILGVASDCVALVLPSVAARAWQARQRATALAGWMVWLATFAFALVSSIGFAATNISDVTMVRASRETPAVTAAQTALGDAMASRDQECRGGVGRHCRQREQAVVDRRQALEAAKQTVAQAAHPQAVAATKLVSWVTAGAISPSENDFGMLRLMLLCLVPQLGGLLVMVART